MNTSSTNTSSTNTPSMNTTYASNANDRQTMLEKPTDRIDRSPWPDAIRREFEQEARQPDGRVGQYLLAETDGLRIWMIKLAPGERVGFHRHVLDYSWTSVTGGHGRQHIMDGTTAEYGYEAGETRHETYAAGAFKVHDLQNIGDADLVFLTIERKRSANPPLPLPETRQGAAA